MHGVITKSCAKMIDLIHDNAINSFALSLTNCIANEDITQRHGCLLGSYEALLEAISYSKSSSPITNLLSP